MASHAARQVTAYDDTPLDEDASDTVNLPQTAQGLLITTAGNIRYINAKGRDSGVIALPVGMWPVQISRIYATGLVAVGRVLYDKDAG